MIPCFHRSVSEDDIRDVKCDVIVLKYCEVLRGADYEVATALGKEDAIHLEEGAYLDLSLTLLLRPDHFEIWSSGRRAKIKNIIPLMNGMER